MGSKGGRQAIKDLNLGFINYRGWHSREVDIMMVKKLDIDVLGLAETFLQQEEIEIGGYTWYGHNRQEYKSKWSGSIGKEPEIIAT